MGKPDGKGKGKVKGKAGSAATRSKSGKSRGARKGLASHAAGKVVKAKESRSHGLSKKAAEAAADSLLKEKSRKSARGKRVEANKAPKVMENTKRALFIRGPASSDLLNEFLSDISQLKQPDSVLFRRRNILRPFEDETPLEFLCERNDTSLFMYVSHNKKRPANLVVGRMHDGHVLDMIEMGIDAYLPMGAIEGDKPPVGNKPLLVFHGTAFDERDDLAQLRSLLIDFFRGPTVPSVSLSGLEHVLSFTADHEGHITMHGYKNKLMKSGTRVPRIELQDMGPVVELSMRRSRLASDEARRAACKVPKQLRPKKKKGVTRDALGSKIGRVHVGREDLSKLRLKKVRGLKRKNVPDEDAAAASDAPRTATPRPSKRGKNERVLL